MTGGAITELRDDPRDGPRDGVREEDKASLRECWLVFARRRYDEPLAQIGTVTTDDPAMAAIYAQSIYDEHPWIEFAVAPRSAIHVVVSP